MKDFNVKRKIFGFNMLFLSLITISMFSCGEPNPSSEDVGNSGDELTEEEFETSPEEISKPNVSAPDNSMEEVISEPIISAPQEWLGGGVSEPNISAPEESHWEGISGPNVSPPEEIMEEEMEIQPSAPMPLDEYVVKLAVDEKIKSHETAELRVWIGADGITVLFDDQTVQAASTIPASIGQFAKITPYAPEFDVFPNEPKCIRIHPSGSDVRFSLNPKEDGSFKVSANIELYEGMDCTGTPVPKTAATLTVFVEVDRKYLVSGKMGEMGAIVWDKFLTFWGAVVALLFAVLLFLIRGKISKKTGFDGRGND